MRIAVFTNKFPSRISTFFARDMRALIDAGLDVDVFAFYPYEPKLWRYVPDILNEDVLPRTKVHHITICDSVRYLSTRSGLLSAGLPDLLRISCSAASFGPTRLLWTTYVLLKAFGWAGSYNGAYDHVLAYWGNYAATCAYLYHRLIGESIPFSMFLHAGMDLYRGQVYMEQKLLHADNIFVVCDFNRRYLQERYREIFSTISPRIHKYHLGLDLTDFQYKPGARCPRRLIAVGALEKYKGFHHLLQSARVLTDRRVNYEIEFIGDGREASSLKRLARELRIERSVNFLGWLPFEKVRAAMSSATILVHPADGAGDAVPTVIKEAMALGLPVIASEIAGIPELLAEGDCGVLVRPGDVRMLANAIELLLNNDSLRLSYASKARKYAEKLFDLWRNGKQLAEIICSSKRADIWDSKPTIYPAIR